MKARRLLVTILLAGSCVALVGRAPAQDVSSSKTSETGVVLTKLSPLVYPPLARQARITGDVEVQVVIRKDGGVESAEVVSGHPILSQAALESAEKSEYECRGCTNPVTYSVVYTFAFWDDGDCCNVGERAPEVKEAQGYITIAAAGQCICDPASYIRIRVRSAKCFYLWKCGLR